jgi:hypothetical protein
VSYEKIGKEHPANSRVKALTEKGGWMCDAVTANAPEGSGNPSCFNYAPVLVGAAHEGSDEIEARLRMFGFEIEENHESGADKAHLLRRLSGGDRLDRTMNKGQESRDLMTVGAGQRCRMSPTSREPDRP